MALTLNPKFYTLHPKAHLPNIQLLLLLGAKSPPAQGLVFVRMAWEQFSALRLEWDNGKEHGNYYVTIRCILVVMRCFRKCGGPEWAWIDLPYLDHGFPLNRVHGVRGWNS